MMEQVVIFPAWTAMARERTPWWEDFCDRFAGLEVRLAKSLPAPAAPWRLSLRTLTRCPGFPMN